MRDISGKYYIMTDENLLNLSKTGDDHALDIILERYKFLVKHEAKKLYLQGGDHDDLIQEGMIGLMKAIKEYDENNATSFHTFAKLCISRQLYSAVKAAARNKHLPLNSYISLHGEEAKEHVEEVEAKPSSNEQNEDPETLYLGQEYEKIFIGMLMKDLSDLEKEVLMLHIMGMSYQDIAVKMHKESKSIDNALQRIKSKAKEVVTKMK